MVRRELVKTSQALAEADGIAIPKTTEEYINYNKREPAESVSGSDSEDEDLEFRNNNQQQQATNNEAGGSSSAESGSSPRAASGGEQQTTSPRSQKDDSDSEDDSPAPSNSKKPRLGSPDAGAGQH